MAWWIEAGRRVAAGSRRSNAASVSAWPCSRVWLSMRLSITRVFAESSTTQHGETHCHPEQGRLFACEEADAAKDPYSAMVAAGGSVLRPGVTLAGILRAAYRGRSTPQRRRVA